MALPKGMQPAKKGRPSMSKTVRPGSLRSRKAAGGMTKRRGY